MRALVIGASGQVGAALLRALHARGHEAVGTWAHVEQPGLVRLDLTDTVATERLVAETRPDWVLCPAALSHVDYCEEHPAEALAANVHGPLGAANAAARAGAGFVYYSSDYVFDGADGPYDEQARPRPLGVYGQSKWEGEQAVQDALERALIVRTSVVYGPERQEKNSAYQVIRACRSGKGFRPAVDQRVSPSYNADGPYDEQARPRPLGVYGQSKWEGEQAVQDALDRALIVRTSVVYGPERQEKNSAYQVIRACRSGKGFRPAVDQRVSPSYNADVAAATVECCERDLRGTWHLAGAEVLDRMAYARLICRAFDLDAACLTPTTTAALGQKAARPLNGGLRIDKARAGLRTPLRGAEAGLRAMRAALEAEPAGG